jgi:hypothetical protein
MVIFCGSSLVFYFLAKGGYVWPIRRIEAQDRIDDAIGRATEMGGILLFGTGYRGLSYSSYGAESVVAISVLRYVVDRCARLGTDLEVVTAAPDHIPLLEDTVNQGAVLAGKPEYYRGMGTMVHQLGGNLFSYVQSIIRILQEGKTRAFLSFGAGGGLSQGTNMVGVAASLEDCYTVGGSAMIHTCFGYVAAFDYGIIGDEVYAMSASVSQDPSQIGTVMGLDMSKAVIMTLLLVGSVLYVLGIRLF